MPTSPFAVDVTPDWEALVRCIRREGTPRRVHHIELFLDGEVQQAVCERFGLLDGLDIDDPYFDLTARRSPSSAFWATTTCGAASRAWTCRCNRAKIDDTAELARAGGRHTWTSTTAPSPTGRSSRPIPGPTRRKATTRALEWYEQNLPDDMCVIGSGGFAHFAEYLTWLMGYETLCYALYDQRDLVQAIADRLIAIYRRDRAAHAPVRPRARSSGAATTWASRPAR